MRARLLALVACALLMIPGQFAVVSATEFNVAGLIVDYGDGRTSYAWVPFPEDEISGIDLLERSGLDVVVVGFGGMGDAVCQIDDTGCPVDDCRQRLCQTSDPESPFWRFLRQTDDGEWALAATGASGATIRNGDINAWVWSGSDVDLPTVTIDEIGERAGADTSAMHDVSSLPQPVVSTDGDSVMDDDGGYINGIGGAVVVLGVAGVAIWWSRRSRMASS